MDDVPGPGPCPRCGTGRAPDGWCPGCLVTTPPASTAFGAPVRPMSRPPRTSLRTTTRTRRTATTFGPVGRVVATLLVVVVVPAGWFSFAPFPWSVPGALFYAVVVVPLALRDVWSAGVVVHHGERRADGGPGLSPGR